MQKLKFNPAGSKSNSKIIINTEIFAAGTGVLCDYIGGEFAEVDGEGAQRGYCEQALASKRNEWS